MSFKGLLNQSITIQTPAVTQDSIGGPDRSWANKYTGLRCRREQLTAIERLVAGREGVEATHRFFIEAGKGITEKMRIRDGSDLYDIVSVVPQRGRRKIHHIEIVAALRK